MKPSRANLDSAFRRLAELRIEEAMREGKFDNLQGAGQPLDLEPMPADEGARMLWWVLRLVRQSERPPGERAYREQIEVLRGHLKAAPSEARVRALVLAINALTHRINELRRQAGQAQLPLLSMEQEMQRFAAEEQGNPPMAELRCTNGRCLANSPYWARFCHRCGASVGPPV